MRVAGSVHVSGTTALDGQGRLVGEGDAYRQTRQILANIERARRLPPQLRLSSPPVPRMSQDDSAPTRPKNGGPRRGRTARGDSPRKGARRSEAKPEPDAPAEPDVESSAATAEVEAPDVEAVAVEGEAAPDGEITAEAETTKERAGRTTSSPGSTPAATLSPVLRSR